MRVASLACLAAGMFAGDPALAQAPSAAEASARAVALAGVSEAIAVTAERQTALQTEIAALSDDRTALSTSLIQTTERAQAIESRLTATTDRLAELFANEDSVRNRLRDRRVVLASVLAALQRMGRNMPPAVLVRPEDALASVRSAILVGAVLPELRTEADALAVDLVSLLSLRDQQERERDRLRVDVGRLGEERRRVELLLAEKRRAMAISERALREEVDRAARLAREAEGLQDLIARVETAVPAAARAGAVARAANPRDPEGDRIAPAVAFASARGRLPPPVSGAIEVAFGVATATGAAEGETFSTLPGALVATPADGSVVYAGPFRSYGQLLIINAGGGYHVLLAGMERIDVELGQFVLAGEPVAVMGARRTASAGGVETGVAQPELYVEFRKDGNSIDPGPWWAQPNDEKVGG